MKKIDIPQEAAKIKKPFTPRHLIDVDGYHVYLGLIQGEYSMHKHPHDEFFYVIEGEMEVESKEDSVKLKKGEGLLVKNGIWHKSKSKKKAIVMMFEKVGLETQLLSQ